MPIRRHYRKVCTGPVSSLHHLGPSADGAEEHLEASITACFPVAHFCFFFSHLYWPLVEAGRMLIPVDCMLVFWIQKCPSLSTLSTEVPDMEQRLLDAAWGMSWPKLWEAEYELSSHHQEPALSLQRVLAVIMLKYLRQGTASIFEIQVFVMSYCFSESHASVDP